MNVVPFDPKHSNSYTREHYFNKESELYFKTWERPISFFGVKNYYPIDSHKAIVRQVGVDLAAAFVSKSKPVVLGIVGKNYKVISTQEVCEAVEDTFIETLIHEQLDTVERTDAMAYDGRTCIRNYIFPSIQADIGSDKSRIAFRVVIINGYDGASSFKFYSGAIDFFCANGMVSGVFDMMRKRHTSGLVMPKFKDKLERSIDVFYKQADTWKEWVGKLITDEQAKVCFSGIPNISPRRIEQLLRQFRIECITHGRTVWALYSAATQFSSHSQGDFTIRDTGEAHRASTLMQRELQIRNWTTTPQFLELAA